MTTDPSRPGMSAHRESYVAIVSLDDVDGIVRDLQGLGIERDAIDVFDPSDTESAELAPESGDDSTVINVVRRMFGFDQVEVERIYVEALDAGQAVVRAFVPEDDDQTRARVEKALLKHGGRFIHYFGKWSYLEVAEDADRADDRTT